MARSADREASSPDLLFFDGDCGLCHGLVGFVARRNPVCRFAPLGGATFLRRIPAGDRYGLPDSVILLQGDRVLLRSEAVLRLLASLGPGWRLLAALGRMVPRAWRDRLYNGVARLRRRFGRPPSGACRLGAPGLGARIDD